MPRFRKDVLKPATYSVLTKDGKGRRRVTYSGADAVHLAQRLKDMKAAGYRVPAAFEHQESGKPMKPEDLAQRLADKSRLFFGYADDAALLSGDTLAFEFEVPSEEDAKQIERVGRVSPEIITDFIDGDGRLWPGKSITHVALTAKPVQMRQGEWQRLSLDYADVVRLSLEDRVKTPLESTLAYLARKKVMLPAGVTLATLRDNVVRLALNIPEKGEKPEKEPKAEGAEEPAETPEVPEGDTPTGSGKDASFSKVLEYLIGQGIHLPPDTTAENFVDRLCVACHALENSQSEPGMNGEVAGGEGGAAATPKPADTGPMMMSLQAKLDKAQAQLLETEKQGITARIAALTNGGISKPIRDKMLADLNTERLSLDDDCKVIPNKLVMQLEAYETLIKDGGLTSVLLGLNGNEKPEVVPNPDDPGTNLDKRVMDRISGGRWKPAAKANGN